MTVTVHIWMPRLGRYGHVSMTLSNGTYISFWPPEDKSVAGAKKGKKSNKKGFFVGGEGGSTNLVLDEDIEKEGGMPDHTIRINKQLDEEEMETWWADWSSTGHYEFLSGNCAWAVYTCLRQGGAPISATLIWRPETIRRYLSYWLNGLSFLGFFNLPGWA